MKTLYQNSRLDVLYYGTKEADCDVPCLVKIEHGQLRLSYEWEESEVTYLGVEVAPGHFEMRSLDVNGRGTLHRFNNAMKLVGSWVEDGTKGMWEIRLGDNNLHVATEASPDFMTDREQPGEQKRETF